SIQPIIQGVARTGGSFGSMPARVCLYSTTWLNSARVPIGTVLGMIWKDGRLNIRDWKPVCNDSDRSARSRPNFPSFIVFMERTVPAYRILYSGKTGVHNCCCALSKNSQKGESGYGKLRRTDDRLQRPPRKFHKNCRWSAGSELAR